MPGQNHVYRLFWTAVILAAGLFPAACSPGVLSVPSATPPMAIERSGRLTPFLTATPGLTAPVITPTTPPQVPTPTPTPRVHEVQKGEDMFGISLRYGVTLDDLLAANPDVQPNFLSIGTLLVIPAASQPAPSAAETGVLPSPTAIPIDGSVVNCSRSKEGGVWCFMTVRNTQAYTLEGITAVFRLADQDAQAILVQRAATLLDRLAPGERLPLAAYFPPPVPDPFLASAAIETALASPEDGRYLPIRLDRQKILLDDSGLTARIELELSLDTNGSTARRIWVVAAAYDLQGNVVGLRRWEYKNENPLASGQSLPVQLEIYSVSGEIDRVEVIAEARP